MSKITHTKACCDCGSVTTTKRCPACSKSHKRDYNTAYVRRMRAKIYATRPAKKCTGCGMDLLGLHRSAGVCLKCAKKRDTAASAAWSKTPSGRAYIYRYVRTLEALEKGRVRNRSPKMVAYRKEYYQRPEIIAREKARRRSPEYKEANLRAVRKCLAKKKKMKEASLNALSEVGKEMP